LSLARAIAALCCAALVAGSAGPVLAADPAAAERQYRIARRLAAEGSPDAAEALQKVLELDPKGQLADDALVDQALLEGLPRWPENLGRLDEASARRALRLLSRVADEFAGADRVSEARYYRALIKLEPLVTFDASDARFDLITVATNPDVSEWTRAARYTGAWLATAVGRYDRAASAYGRLLIDAPLSPAAARASVGLASLRLHEGQAGEAARLLQHAIEQQVPSEMHATLLRELAVRLVLAQAGAGGALVAKVRRPSTGIKSLVDMATTADGLLLADARDGAIVALDATGSVAGSWSVEAAQSVAADGLGRLYAANDQGVYRLAAGGETETVAMTGDFAAPLSLDVESNGRVWLLDRKGESLGKVEPGTTAPLPVWSQPGRRLSAIRWDGRRLLAIDPKNKLLIAFDGAGQPSPLPVQDLQKPVAFDTDPAGRIAVLEAKDGVVRVLNANGTDVVRFSCKEAGIEKPTAVGLGADGTVHVFDQATSGWYVLR
jgi:hypothetical protein